jgi:cullin-associated NEDD8-dissociated protein 1
LVLNNANTFFQSAYESLYTLIPHPALPVSTLPQVLQPVRSGMLDDQEIRLLSLLSLHKALEVHSIARIGPLLPTFIDDFKKILGVKPRDQAVKQELERMEEGKRGVVKIALDATQRFPEGLPKEWLEWWTAARVEHAALVRSVEDEAKMGGRDV